MVPGISVFGRFGPWWDIFERKIILGPWEIKSYQNRSLDEKFEEFTKLVLKVSNLAEIVPGK